MTQVFADGEQLGSSGMAPAPALPMIRQRNGLPEFARPDIGLPDIALPDIVPLDAFGPALTAGKGVRPVRCVGCAQPTLPRQDDNAPLCVRCSELLSQSGQRTLPGRRRRRWLTG